MAYARTVFIIDAAKAGLSDPQNRQFDVDFPYLQKQHVKLVINGTASLLYAWVTDARIELNVAPSVGDVIAISRETSPATRLVDYQTGSVLSDEILDQDSLQGFYLAQEANDLKEVVISRDGLNRWDAESTRIVNLADPVDNTDAANKQWVVSSTQVHLAAVNASKDAAALSETNTSASEAAALASQVAAAASEAASATDAATVASNLAAAAAAETAAELAETNAETALAAATVQANLATTNGATQVGLATDQVTLATTQAGLATTNGAAQVVLATDQVALATTQAGLATTNGAAQVTLATTQAGLATTNGAAQVALATTQASNAAGSAATASTQAGIATTKAGEASASASAAAASAASITDEETNAAASAAASAGSATASANSAASAAAALDNFDDRYLGPKSSEPTTDNDGNALISGSLYFSTAQNAMQVFDGANWIAASAAGVASMNLYEYTATAGQTTFTGSDDNGNSISYIQGNEIVVLNGIILDPSDYTSTSGTSIVLDVGAAVSDLLNVYAFKSFTVADTVSASTGGTFGGNVTVTGTLAATTLTGDGSAITGLPAGYTDTDVATYLAGTSPTVGGLTTTADVSFGDNDKAIFGAGSDLQIYHNGSDSFIDEAGTGNLNIRANPTVQIGKYTGEVSAQFIADGEVNLRYNNAQKLATTATGISVTGTVAATTLQTTAGGTVTTASGNDLNIVYPAGRSLFIKEGSETHVTVDNAGSVGIGTSSPDNKVNIQESALAGRGASNGNTSMTIEHATDTGIQFFSATQTQIRFGDAASTGAGSIIYEHATDKLRLNTGSLMTFEDGGVVRMSISSTGVISGDGSGLTGVGASTTFGAVGTYTWGRPANNTDYTEGDVATGLYTVGQVNNDKNPYYDAGGWGFEVVGTAMSGSWRAMARIGKDTSNQAWTGLWVRIS